MYAIDLYSSSPEKGQRQVAEATRKQFGLTTFAHTTVGRAVRAFIRIIVGGTAGPEETDAGTNNGNNKERSFPSTQWTRTLRKQAEEFLRDMLGQTGRQPMVAACCGLVREWYMKYRRFLL